MMLLFALLAPSHAATSCVYTGSPPQFVQCLYGELTALDDDVTLLEGEITSLQSDIAAAQATIAIQDQLITDLAFLYVGTSAHVSNNTIGIQDNADAIVALDARVDATDANVTLLEADMALFESDILAFDADIAQFNADLGLVYDELEGFDHLYCQILSSSGLCDLEPSCVGLGYCGQQVFVSSATYNGNLVGVSGADGACQALATAAGLDGTYKAWISRHVFHGLAPVNSFTQHSDPYWLLDGTKIAENFDDLVDGSLLAPIDIDETGAVQTGIAWTSTNTDGSGRSLYAENTCSDWQAGSSMQDGGVGTIGATDATWTDDGIQTCELTAHLYCFGQ